MRHTDYHSPSETSVPQVLDTHKHTPRFLGNALMTLVFTPEHSTLHKDIEVENSSIQPLQPDVRTIVCKIGINIGQYSPSPAPKFDARQLTDMAALLVQFSEYSPDLLPEWLKLDYADVDALHAAICYKAQEIKAPLDFADQFACALDTTDGNVFQALFKLFVASRTYARWLDEPLIQSGLTTDQKKEKMMSWRKSVASCKLTEHNQDPAGDTYYAWTHALAQYIFTITPFRQSIATRSVGKLFENGTTLMHAIIHKLNKQTVPNNHGSAAIYGNEIGAYLCRL